ncbi:MAG: DNA polymerase Y family protein, partial [Chloroflexi bacterium]|nr:DNA polymerase Y family protein [Chloroflexota bacterium]
RATIVAHLERGGSWSREVVFKEALRERRRLLLSVCGRWLEGGLPGAVEALTLVAEELSGEVGHQMSLFRERRPPAAGEIQEALQQLRARYGPDLPVYSIVEVEPWSRIPERRWALAPYIP